MSPALPAVMRAVFDGLPDALLVIDPLTLRIVECNRAACLSLAFERDELLGREVADIESSIEAVFFWDNVRAGDYSESDAPRGFYKKRNDEVIAVEKQLTHLQVEGATLFLIAFHEVPDSSSAEEALIRSTSLLSATLEATADGILVTRPDGGISNMNHRLADMWRLPNALLEAGDDERILAFMRAQLPDSAANVLTLEHDAAGGVESVFHAMELRDGRHFESYMTPLYVNAHFSGRVFSFRDVTGQKQAEASIRESEERVRSVFDNSPMMICLSTFPEGRIIEMNDACRRACDVAADAVDWPTGEADLWSDEDERDLCVYQLRQNGGVRDFEAVMRRRGGELFPVQYSANLIHLSGGAMNLLSMQDITARKHAERMQNAQNNISEAAHSATDLPDLCRRLHMIVGEMMPAHNFLVALAPSVDGDPLSFPYVVDQQRPSGEPGSVNRSLSDIVLRVAKAQLFTAEALEAMFVDDPEAAAEQRPEGWLGVPLISDRRSIGVVGVSIYSPDTRYTDRDEALLQFVANQVTIVIERKHVEAQQRLLDLTLQQRNQELEKASRVKSEFLANMSHEIRTPMSAIIGLSRLCLGTDLQPQQRDYVEKVFHAGSSLLGIINDILDISKVEAGKLEIEAIPFTLDQVFDNLSNLVMNRVQEKGLSLVFDLAAERRRLVGDPLRLGQVLLNLVGNAIKFTQRGEIRVSVQRLFTSDTEVVLEFYVRDSGIGMTPEQCARLFQPFSQADASTTRKYGGTGLGLAISKSLVELMGGHIRVESEARVGTSFVFEARFGRAIGLRGDRAKERPVGAVTFTGSEGLRGRAVLVVEDNLINQQIAREWLAKVGMRVSVANNGREAVERVREGGYEAVLMDLQMPEMDGFEATRAIRAIAGFQQLPIIAMTANAMASDRQQCLDAGMNDHVSKPIDPDRLFEVLVHWLPGAAAPAIATGGNPEPARSIADSAAPPAGTAADQHPWLIAGLPGIDVDAALTGIGGNAALLQSLLLIFMRDHASDAAQIEQALQQQDPALAQRIAHTLKGVAGSIGAAAVQEAAKALEAALRAGESAQYRPLVGELQAALTPVVLGLSGLARLHGQAPGVAAEADPAVDPQRLRQLIDEIGARMAEYDPEAGAVAENLRQYCRHGAAGEAAERLAQQLSLYKFDEAGVTLEALKLALEAAS